MYLENRLRCLLLLSALLSVVACNGAGQTVAPTSAVRLATPTIVAAPVPADGAARVNVAEAKDAILSGRVLVVDVRDSLSFSQGHIKGAINIPLYDFEAKYTSLPREREIITYCA